MLEYRSDQLEKNLNRLHQRMDRLSEDMNKRFFESQQDNHSQFLNLEKRISEVHHQMVIQTRWLLTGLLATGTIISVLLPVITRLSELYLK